MKTKLNQFLNIVYTVGFLLAFLIYFFGKFIFCNMTIRILGPVCAVFIVAACSFIKKHKDFPIDKFFRERHLVYPIFALLLLFIQIFIAASLDYVPVTDARYIDIIARNFVNGGVELYDGLNEIHQHYLARYSNNWALFLILSFWYKLLDTMFGHIPEHSAEIINIAAIQLAFFFVFKITKLVFESARKRFAALAIFMLCPIIYSYTSYLYTDTLSMPFVTLSILLYLKAMKADNTKRFAVCTAGFALCTAVGFSVKGSVAIIVVAAVIMAFLKLDWKKCAATAVASAIALAAVSGGVSAIMKGIGAVDDEELEKYQFPTAHWIMMGLKNVGNYDHEDFLFTYGFDGIEAKKEADVKVIGERLNEYGLSGMIVHLAIKSGYTWSGAMYLTTHILSRSPESPVRDFFRESKFFHDYCFVFQTLMMLFMLFSFVGASAKRKDDMLCFVRLSVFGLSLFLLIWETRSRYMVGFLPIYFLLAADGIGFATEQFDKLCLKHKNRKGAEKPNETQDGVNTHTA